MGALVGALVDVLVGVSVGALVGVSVGALVVEWLLSKSSSTPIN